MNDRDQERLLQRERSYRHRMWSSRERSIILGCIESIPVSGVEGFGREILAAVGCPESLPDTQTVGMVMELLLVLFDPFTNPDRFGRLVERLDGVPTMNSIYYEPLWYSDARHRRGSDTDRHLVGLFKEPQRAKKM